MDSREVSLLFELYTHCFVRQQHLAKPPGPSRCFPFWQELLACYVMNTESDDTSGAQKCLPALEDYYECLHHKKEVRPFALAASPARLPPWMLISGLLISMQGRWSYSGHIERRSRHIQGNVRRGWGLLGTWGYWARRKIRRKF